MEEDCNILLMVIKYKMASLKRSFSTRIVAPSSSSPDWHFIEICLLFALKQGKHGDTDMRMVQQNFINTKILLCCKI